MPKLSVVTRSGHEVEVDAEPGGSIMEALRNGGVDEVLALCGGALACATCHVFIDPSEIEKLVPPSDDERDLLDTSANRRPNSRLSCQIVLTDELDGLRVTIAPEE